LEAIYKIKDCQKCGFKHLTPKPSEKILKKFYREDYHQKFTHHLHDFKKEMSEEWWINLKSEEHLFFLKKFGKNKGKILDVGCGNGFFLKYMKKNDWQELGIEISPRARANAKKLGVKTQSDFRGVGVEKFDVVMLRFVLEHMRNPTELLKKVRKYLKKGGILITIVPNDFNPLQLSTEKIGIKKWWIRQPDHINYFNFESLTFLLQKCGYKPIQKFTDFPMEIFLLMGDNYVKNNRLGSLSHKKRMMFEKNVEWRTRRKIYESFAKQGIGRSCIIYAKK
jgi:2-polyprenyl-3-methyl-5-hydroxy-6-metoxy-1,4-benzoquinol methylase